MRTPPGSRRRTGAIAATVLAVGLLVGCGGAAEPTAGREAAPPAGAADERQDAPGRDVDAAAPEGKPDQRGVPAQAPKRIPVPGRSVVYAGRLTVEAQDVAGAAAEATRLVTAAGGFVAGDERRAGRDRAAATLMLRVPGARFHDTVGHLAELGKEVDRALTVDDVTEAVVDLDTRIASQQASVVRVRALLARADRIESIVAIERELASREAELASLQAQKRGLADQVAYSTITLELAEPKEKVTKKDPEPGFLAGLEAGWGAFVGLVVLAVTALGALLPFVLVLALPGAVVWFALRRRRRAPAAPPAAATATSGPPSGGSSTPAASG